MLYTVKELSVREMGWITAHDYATKRDLVNVSKSTAFRFVKFHKGAYRIDDENGNTVYYG